MKSRDHRYPDDIPETARVVVQSLQHEDRFELTHVFLETLEAISIDERHKTLDQRTWDKLPKNPPKVDLLRLQPQLKSQHFRQQIADRIEGIELIERQAAMRELHSQLAVLSEAPNLEDYGRIAQFAADNQLPLESIPQFSLLFNAVHNLKLEERDERAYRHAEREGTIAAFKRYLDLDLPLRFRKLAEKRIGVLSDEEGVAWKAICDFMKTQASSAAEREERSATCQSYLEYQKTRWVGDQAEERTKTIHQFDKRLLMEFEKGAVEARDVWNRSLLESTQQEMIPVLRKSAVVRWDSVDKHSIAKLLDLLEDPTAESVHDRCEEQIASLVTIADGEDGLTLSVGDVTFSFLHCPVGTINTEKWSNDYRISEGLDRSLPREIVCCSKYWFQSSIVTSEQWGAVRPAAMGVGSDRYCSFLNASRIADRLNRVCQIAGTSLQVSLPTENQWEYAVASLLECDQMKLDDRHEWCRDDFDKYNENDKHQAFDVSAVKYCENQEVKVVKGGNEVFARPRNGNQDFCIGGSLVRHKPHDASSRIIEINPTGRAAAKADGSAVRCEECMWTGSRHKFSNRWYNIQTMGYFGGYKVAVPHIAMRLVATDSEGGIK